MTYTYINPLGEITDISYNNVDLLMKTEKTRNAQLESFEKKYESYNLHLGIWSFSASILILTVLIFIRNVKD
jgi:hypothetical protein